MAIRSTNPATGEVVASFEEFTPEEVDARLARAQAAYQAWRTVPLAERAMLLKRVADLAMERKSELARLMTLEMGKRTAEALEEIDMSVAVLRWFADNAPRLLTDTAYDSSLGPAVIRRLPIGVLLLVMPWNFPMFQIVRVVAPNLMLGNAIACKHASNMPQFSIAFEQLFTDVGAPDGLYVNLLIGGERASALMGDARIVAGSLTGSERAGAAFAEHAGRNLKKCVLELGGSDPMVVLADADFDAALEAALAGRLLNAGQECISPKRIIVERPLYGRFVEKLVERVHAIRVGDPTDPGTQMGPMVSEKAVDGLLGQVRRAVDGGAVLQAGGKRIDRAGAWVEPTVLTDMRPSNPVYPEELFGPVFVLFEAADDAEAIDIANDTPFGLGASVFGGVSDHAQALAERIDAGMVMVNQVPNAAPDVPFGGVKRSGYGRELSPLCLEEFCNRKVIVTRPATRK